MERQTGLCIISDRKKLLQSKDTLLFFTVKPAKITQQAINVSLCYQTKGKTSLMFIFFKLQKVRCKNVIMSNNTTLKWLSDQREPNSAHLQYYLYIPCHSSFTSFTLSFTRWSLKMSSTEIRKYLKKKTLIFLISNLRCTKDELHILFSCISSWHLCSHILLCSSFFKILKTFSSLVPVLLNRFSNLISYCLLFRSLNSVYHTHVCPLLIYHSLLGSKPAHWGEIS